MPSITLTIYLYDTSNKPLHRTGIAMDLYDATTTVCLGTDISRDLNPNPSGVPSNEWGGKIVLTTPLRNPIDIVFRDAMFEYPGNTMRYLNGDVGGRVDADLEKLPTHASGHPRPPASAAPARLARWVDTAPKWSSPEKRAVKQLIFNYCEIVVARMEDQSVGHSLGSTPSPSTPIWAPPSSLTPVTENWSAALKKLGIPPSLLEQV